MLAAGRQAGGPETYEVEVLRALARIDSETEYFVYCTEENTPAEIGIGQDNFTFRILRPASRLLSLSLTLPVWLVRDKIDVLHATYTPPPYSTKTLVFTMHGMVNFLHPEFFDRAVVWRLNRLMKIGLKKAARVICVSAHVRDQVHTLMGVPMERLTVAYHGVSSAFSPVPKESARKYVRENLGVDTPYVLYVGKLHPCKNIPRLLESFSRFRADTKAEIKLLLVGKATDDEEIRRAVDEIERRRDIIWAGHRSHSELPLIYSGAEMFVFPTYFESFGLPVVEAMACGTAVVASNVASVPEITAGAAMLVDPLSVDDIAEKMARLYDSEQTRSELIARGFERAKDFTWESCARQTLETYEAVASYPKTRSDRKWPDLGGLR